MLDIQRKLAVVTGASTTVLNSPENARRINSIRSSLQMRWRFESAADQLRREGGSVEAVQVDLCHHRGYGKIMGGR